MIEWVRRGEPWPAVYGYAPDRLWYRATWWQVGTAPADALVPVYPQSMSVS